VQRKTAYVLGGIGVAVLAWILLPWWVTTLLVLAIIATPVVAYAMLDSSQKRRLKNLASRQIGSGR
jgi:cell division protein FtsW (lipid II flippase)